MAALQKNEDLMGGSITSYKMEEILKNIHNDTINNYEDYQSDTTNQLLRTQDELARLERELEKKVRVTG